MSKKESARWTVEVSRRPCRCGAQAQHVVNCGRRRRREVLKHTAPDGSSCPYFEHQEGVKRTNKALVAAGLPPDPVPSAPYVFDP